MTHATKTTPASKPASKTPAAKGGTTR